MEILLYKDLIINFVSQTLENKDQQRLINKIFSNDDSVFIYSKKFFQFIKDELGANFNDEINALITKLSDNGSNIKSSDDSQNFNEELLHIYQAHSKNVLVTFAHLEPPKAILDKIPNIAIISKCIKPNYHWIVSQLAILHPNKVTVNCLDFARNQEIKEFFDNVFKLPKAISRMNIFDRQTNQFAHDKFDSFKNNTTIFYYTYRHKNFLMDEISIRNAFRRINIYTTTRNTEIHSRKLVFEGLVLTSTHDFNELLVGGDWEVDILYCQTEAIRWINRCRHFRQV